ncbi:MAG TPA: hypothetical protein VFA71_09220 [Terriglobales bacterium]|nr:hypothetical protein [Terriglobales bacterium]
MDRPVGVTVIAILQFLGAAFLILAGIGFILGGGIIGSLLSQNSQLSGAGLTGIMAGLGAVFAVVLFVFAAIAAILGWGMWQLKNWARIVTLVLAGIGIVFGGLGLLFSLLHFHVITIVFIGIRLAINALIIWYLLQPDVKAAFEGRPRAITATA